MGTFEDAYSQIKALESSGQLTLPETQQTVSIGTIHADTGTFSWFVPTITQKMVVSPPPTLHTAAKTTETTVGVVATTAVDLRLSITVSGGSGQSVQISGYPIVSATAGEIVVDLGLALSDPIPATTPPSQVQYSPPLRSFGLTAEVLGHPALTIPFVILRPPAMALGAFTIPALPVTIVYAPVQGAENKNVVTYTDTETFTRTVTTTIVNTTATKTVQAYSVTDFIAKGAAAIAAVVAVVGTGGAAAAPSVAGGLSEIATALLGSAASGDATSTAKAAQGLANGLSLIDTIVNDIDPVTAPSDTNTVQAESDTSLTVISSEARTLGSAAGEGPGSGDRIVYLPNVRVVWMVINGGVSIAVLGHDPIDVQAASSLLQDRSLLESGKPGFTGLDLATINMLLKLDPFAPPATAGLVSATTIAAPVGPAVIGPPRFVAANPSDGQSGSGTSSTGDILKVSYETTQEDKNVTTSSQVNVTDVKPGMLDVLFGADNVETTTTTTFTTSQTADVKVDETTSTQITVFSNGDSDQYSFLNFYDRQMQAILFVDANSPLLRSGGGLTTARPATPTAPTPPQRTDLPLRPALG